MSVNNYYYSSKTFNSQNVVFYYLKTIVNKLLFIILLILSILFMTFYINNNKIINFIDTNINYLAKPAFFLINTTYNKSYNTFAFISNLFILNKDNTLLKQQNELLKQEILKTTNIIDENNDLKKLLNFIDYNGEKEFITLKPSFIVKNKFNHKLRLDFSQDLNIANEDYVFDSNGYFIGKIINYNNNKAEILLITDFNSRIPAIINRNKMKIIVSGTNSQYLNIVNYLGNNLDLQEGDIIFSTNDGNILSDNLYLGTVVKVNNELKIQVHNKFDFINFILIIHKK